MAGDSRGIDGSVVTGGSFGIGRATALGLAKQGLQVVIVGRDEERARAAVADIRRDSNNEKVIFLIADLSVMASVKELAARVLQNYPSLDVLVNNAGGQFPDCQTTSDGFERTWALNHLAFVELTLDLLPALGAAPRARIINVASSLHASGRIDFNGLLVTPPCRKRYRMMRSYSQSKLANVLFTAALAKRLEGSAVTANSLHPGIVHSGLTRELNGIMSFASRLFDFVRISPEQGAATSIYLATSPEVEGVSGRYFAKCNPIDPSTAARDVALQERLWAFSLAQLHRTDPFQEPNGA